MWIIQLYSLLYGLYEVLNKKIQTMYISCQADWLIETFIPCMWTLPPSKCQTIIFGISFKSLELSSYVLAMLGEASL